MNFVTAKKSDINTIAKCNDNTNSEECPQTVKEVVISTSMVSFGRSLLSLCICLGSLRIELSFTLCLFGSVFLVLIIEFALLSFAPLFLYALVRFFSLSLPL